MARAYHRVFGGELTLKTFAEFGRSAGPGDAIAHGILREPVSLFVADISGEEESFSSTGLLFSLLGTTSAMELRAWFDALAADGEIRDALQLRPWGAWDGQVMDRFGVSWLVGFEESGHENS